MARKQGNWFPSLSPLGGEGNTPVSHRPETVFRDDSGNTRGWTVDLVPLPGQNPPAEVRLRAGLKTLLRAHGLRCVSVRPLV
jgi:hypothetical protein